MIKRAMKTNFGGAWVFPGGKVDSSDYIKNINKYSPSLNDEEASRRLGIKSGGLIYWIACIRECFEESGILLADNKQRKINLGSLTDSELEIINQYKKKLLEGKDVFLELIDKFNLTLSTSEIAYISHWITPKIEKRRYSTRFFIARCPNQLATHDGVEGVESRWLEPKVALDLYNSGEFPMIMPTIKNLELIKDFQNTKSLLLSMNDKSIIDIPKVEPVFDVVDGKPKLISY
jgi:8-oxo-dGTP pyrophosphatase MutT (NUDIX family)